MRKIAFYLPQFHSIPENDEWWGKNFTEWTNVRGATPQFRGHNQPEVPYNNNYYNLLSEETQIWQAHLAREYGIDGFCYYHYWFDGKLLLEKPMEKMLNNSKVNIPFCISWANESWTRSWDGLNKNILIQQNYDEDESMWKEHFDYLLKFFNDSRYISEDGKPLLIIYKPHLISNCKKMLDYWRKLSIENGFQGLYIGAQHPSSLDYDLTSLGVDFGIEFEPLYTMHKIVNLNILKKIMLCFRHPSYVINKIRRFFFDYPNVIDYDLTWNRIVKRIPLNKRIAAGAFTSWDNTPRKGKNAVIFKNANPSKFETYFKERLNSAEIEYGIDFIFINAWNEWAEGAHLEPDSRFGYGYLEAIKKSVK